MGSKKKKIHIATDEETEKYAPPDQENQPPAAESPPEQTSDEQPAPAADDIADLKLQVEEFKEKHLRAKADFQNLQRRSQRERTDAVRFANADFAKSLLHVLDDFERTCEAAKADNATVDSVVEGVRLVYESLKKVLADHGITETVADEQPFDPNLHEAIMQQPSDQHPNMTVLQTVQKGYQYRDRVIRPAKVIVSKAPEDPTTEDQTDPPS